MPIFEVEDKSGRVLEIEGDRPPTEDELKEIFSAVPAREPSTRERVGGAVEVAGSLASSAVAEPLAGLAGLGTALTSGSEEGAKQVGETRDALTFEPKTDQGQAQLQQLQEMLAPIGQALEGVNQFFGERGSDLLSPFGETGEAVGSAAGQSLTTAIGAATGGKPALTAAASRPRVTPESRAAVAPFAEAKESGNFGDTIAQGVVGPSQARQEAIDSAYSLARETSAGQAVRISTPAAFLSKQAGSEAISGGVVSALKSELKNRGLVDSDGKATLKNISITEAEDLRIAANELFSSASPKGKRIIAEFNSRIDNDVANVVGDDVFGPAREQFKAFKDSLSRTKASEFDESRKNVLNDILQNKLEPDKISQRLTSASKQDIKQLKDFFEANGQDDSILALKASVLRDFLDGAEKSGAKGFENAIKRFNGKDGGKLRELFDPDELRQLNGLRPKKVDGVGEEVKEAFLARADQVPLVNLLVGPLRRLDSTTVKRRFDKPQKTSPK